MIDTHVRNRGPAGTRSPADGLLEGSPPLNRLEPEGNAEGETPC
jgi:hypothetical protein